MRRNHDVILLPLMLSDPAEGLGYKAAERLPIGGIVRASSPWRRGRSVDRTSIILLTWRCHMNTPPTWKAALSALLAMQFTCEPAYSQTSEGTASDEQTVVAAASASQPVTASPAKSASTGRLSRSIVPVRYDLTFKPDLEKFTFSGSAKITVDVREKTQHITLNALDLTIKNVMLSSAGGKTQKGASVALEPETERANLSFPGEIAPGQYTLSMEFDGTLNDKLRGFYRSYYTDGGGTKHWLATTQMEPTDARRMFPCFDEPEMKAVFNISAVIDRNLVAISNGSVGQESIDKNTGLKTVDFQDSPKMSSYLVALVIGNFKRTESKTVCGVPITVWALAGKENLGKFSLDEACKIFEYQTKYFGIPYPGKKLDLIAIPDFRSGAMENLGAITFREANLLVDEKTGSNFLKRNASEIVAHELAHQWFGDLVTMRWWDDIWLNEAFASWMGAKTADAIHPDWQVATRSIFTRNSSMLIDELKATRAIHAEVNDPKQAAEMFDSITYDKGESILWMLESYVGSEKFREGIQSYLKQHLFANATGEDLWEAIGSASGLPVPEVMKSWVLQPGFPLVSVKHENGCLRLSQQRFFGLPDLDPDSSLWKVPVVVRNFENENKLTPLLVRKEETFAIDEDWNSIVVNAGGHGFYRTKYEAKDQSEVLDRFDSLSIEERLALLNDINALVWKGMLPAGDKLALLLRTPNETEPLAQEKLVDWCSQPFVYLDTSEHGAYQKLFAGLLLPVKNNVGWEEKPGERDSVKDLRRSVVELLGTRVQDQQTIKEARSLFEQYMKDRQSIPPDIAGAVLAIVAYNGGTVEYNRIRTALTTETVPELEKRLLTALTKFSGPALIERTLNMVLSSDVRSQDGFRLLSGLLEGHRTKHQTWHFVKSHWSEITSKFPPRSLTALVSACTSFDRTDEETDLRTFFNAHDLPYSRSAIARMLEEVHRRVVFRKANENTIRGWVKQKAANQISSTDE